MWQWNALHRRSTATCLVPQAALLFPTLLQALGALGSFFRSQAASFSSPASSRPDPPSSPAFSTPGVAHMFPRRGRRAHVLALRFLLGTDASLSPGACSRPALTTAGYCFAESWTTGTSAKIARARRPSKRAGYSCRKASAPLQRRAGVAEAEAELHTTFDQAVHSEGQIQSLQAAQWFKCRKSHQIQCTRARDSLRAGSTRSENGSAARILFPTFQCCFGSNSCFHDSIWHKKKNFVA